MQQIVSNRKQMKAYVKKLCVLQQTNQGSVFLLIFLHLVGSVLSLCPCPIQEDDICYKCRCELTPENEMAINCKGKGLTQVPTFTSTSTAFTEVTLADNQISTIPAEKFQQLHSLKHLDLRGNPVNSIDNLAFAGLDSTLVQLFLEVNAITTFPKEALSMLQILKTLSATGFDLSSTGLPSGALGNLNQLSQLVLSNNRMRSLVDDALSGQVNSLQELNLDSNSFSSIPTSALSRLLALEQLSFSKNSDLTSIADGAFQGTHLRSIDLSQNGLSSIGSSAFSGLESTLQILDMRSCQLQDNMLPPLQQLSSVRELDLSSNSIANIPSGMFAAMNQMEMLQLHENQIHTITDTTLSGLANLQMLDLSGNGLTNIHSNAFAATPALKQLIIGNNVNLSPSLANNIFQPLESTLEVLLLDQTAFSESHWHLIQNLTRLTTLKLSNNLITVLMDMGLNNLTNLQNIYFDSNSLTEVTQRQIFGPTAHLELINFNQNNLNTLDECVFYNFEQVDYYKLGLKDNPLHCDCKLKWLLQELKQNPNYDFLKYAVGWTCASPPELSGKKFAYEVNESELVCDPPVTFPPCLDLTPATTTTTTPTSTTLSSTAPFRFQLNITEVTDVSMLLYWFISDTVKDDLLGFRIQYRTVPDGSNKYIDLSYDARTYSLSGLEPGTEYLICVQALGIQESPDTVCDNAFTEPKSDEASTAKGNTLIIVLSCTLGVLVIFSIIMVIAFLRRRQKKKAADRQNNPFGIRAGYDSKRFSRATTPNTSTLNLHGHENAALDRNLEGFTKEEQNRILGLISKYGASTLSMLSTASSKRYTQDLPPAPPQNRSSCFVVDDPASHIYCEIPEEGAYENDTVDSYLDRNVRLSDMNDASGVSV